MSNEKIVKLYTKDAARNPDAVLEQAIGNYNEVVIVGWDKTDTLDVRLSTDLKKSDILFLLDLFRHKLLAGDYDE